MANVPVDMNPLTKLADVTVQQAAANFGVAVTLPEDLQASLAAKQAEQKKKLNDDAATEILNLAKNSDEFIVKNVQRAKLLQKEIDDLNTLNSEVQRALAYGMSTRNFLPLARMIGLGIPSTVDKALLTIPKDWVMPVAPEAAEAEA